MSKKGTIIRFGKCGVNGEIMIEKHDEYFHHASISAYFGGNKFINKELIHNSLINDAYFDIKRYMIYKIISKHEDLGYNELIIDFKKAIKEL